MERLLMESFSNLNNKKIPFDYFLNDEIFKNKENGFFIELGAFDGLVQSNTAFFEKYKNWTGVLVEPSREKYEECLKNRPNSECFNFACSFEEKEVKFNHENGMMTKIVIGEGDYSCEAIRLENILDQCDIPPNIDFLSLDVEGYELEVLMGINLDKYRPNYMLIELWDTNQDEVNNFLEKNNYKCLMNLSNYNLLDNPSWGHNGHTHNDFLFVDYTI
jgi:FkbM family methyltransferase